MAMARIFLLMAALHGANVALAETEVKGRPALVLDGEAAQVVVDLLGGSIADFQYIFLDAGQTIAKVYAAFLFEIPSDYAGTEQVALIDDRLVVRPRGTTGNRAKAIEAAAGAVERTNADLEMEVDALFIE